MPVTSGWAIRIHELTRGLAAHAEVTLYCRISALTSQRLGIEPEVLLKSSDARRFAAIRSHEVTTRRDPDGMPWWRSAHDPLQRMLAEDHQRTPYSAVVCCTSVSANIAWGLLGKVPIVLDEHNIESRVRPMVLAMAGSTDPTPADAEANLQAWERQIWPAVDLVTCVSEDDRRHIQAVRQGPTRVVRNGTGAHAFRAPSERGGDEVLFVGTFGWPPNERAALFLAGEVMPRVWTELPSARLTLCGMSPTARVRAVAGPRVEVTGSVPSVEPYLDRAAVFANALFEGGGSSLKPLEAMACGLPLISTRVGVRGHDLLPGHSYLPAETAAEFASAIVDVLRRRTAFDGQARQAREIASSHDWRDLGREFADLVQSLSA